MITTNDIAELYRKAGDTPEQKTIAAALAIINVAIMIGDVEGLRTALEPYHKSQCQFLPLRKPERN